MKLENIQQTYAGLFKNNILNFAYEHVSLARLEIFKLRRFTSRNTGKMAISRTYRH